MEEVVKRIVLAEPSISHTKLIQKVKEEVPEADSKGIKIAKAAVQRLLEAASPPPPSLSALSDSQFAALYAPAFKRFRDIEGALNAERDDNELAKLFGVAFEADEDLHVEARRRRLEQFRRVVPPGFDPEDEDSADFFFFMNHEFMASSIYVVEGPFAFLCYRNYTGEHTYAIGCEDGISGESKRATPFDPSIIGNDGQYSGLMFGQCHPMWH